MKAMWCRNHPVTAVVWGLILTLFVLTGCGTPLEPLSTPNAMVVLSTPPAEVCETCALATHSAAMTQEKNNADFQTVATAEIERANAQATLNSAEATLHAAQTQDQNDANYIAAQIAATAEIVRANALATVNSAGATQNAALTQDAIRQTQMAELATANAQAILIQQNKDDLVAGTQTAIANNIATQTQVAAATAQWYTDQARQRDEQRQGPITFLWMVCLPVFAVLLAGVAIWGFWRWLKIRQARQYILKNPVEIIEHHPEDALPFPGRDTVENRYQLTKPEDQVGRWVDEVKSKLASSDKEDEDDHTDN
jgi:hypothetical protein